MVKRILFFVMGMSFGFASLAFAEQSPELVVYKSPYCGCCQKWVEHLKEEEVKVSVKQSNDVDVIKKQFGIPENKASCHTAVAGKYVFEGHIPAADIKTFLKNPKGKGLVVPGMPIGSPGMEYKDKKEPYDILLLKEDGTTEVFREVRPTSKSK